MKQANKICSVVLALVLLLTLCLSPALASMNADVIYIGSAEELMELSGKCALDSWSQGKTVLLTCDIDLSGTEYTPIPTFGGTFDGQGHTISGLALAGSGDVRGLFRYIQEQGVVRDLRVEGSILPAERKDFIGGIAGNNRGTISNCSFHGVVSGKNTVGGLVGINEASGQIISSVFFGSITAEHYVGGIAGQNLGSIVQCENSGAINTTEVKASTTLESIELDSLTDAENAPVVTDVGGIAGFSSGVIQGCLNMGQIGYPHVGYNIGGIAGRQTGYLDSCTNEGTVQGRKDVGGIAGQMEPQLTLKYDESTLNRIWAELDALESKVDTLLTNASGSAHNLTDEIGQMSTSAGVVKDAVSDLSDALTGWADGSIDQINDASARISWVLERVEPILDTVELAMDQLEASAGQFADGLSQASAAAELGADAAAELSLAMADIETAIEDGRAAFQHISQAIKNLKQGLGDSSAAEAALDELTGGLSDISAAFSDIAESLHRVRLALDRVYDWVSEDESWALLESGVDNLRYAAELVAQGMSSVGAAVEAISGNQDLQLGRDQLRTALDALLTGMEHLGDAYFDISAALEQFEENTLPRLLSHTKNGLQMMGSASGKISSAMNEIDAVMQIISEDENLELAFLELISASEDLETALSYANEAEPHVGAALDALEAFSGGEADQLAVALDHLDQAMPYLRQAGTSLFAASEHLTQALQALNRSGDAFEAAAAHIDRALEDISGAASDFGAACDSFAAAIALLESEEMEKVSERLDDGSADLDLAVSDLLVAIDNFQAAMETLDGSESLKQQWESLEAGAKELNAGVGAVGRALELINTALGGIERSGIPEETEKVLQREAELLDVFLQQLTDAFERVTSSLEKLEDNLDPASLESALTELDNAIDDLDLAAEGLKQSVQHMEQASALLEEAADQLAASMDTFSRAGESLESAFASLEQAVADVDSLLEELVQMPAIQFEHMEDHVSDEGAALDAAATDFLNCINDLSSVLRTESDVLSDDLKDINEQIGAIVDLLHQVQQEQEEIEDEEHLEDVSGQDSGDTRSSGKISSCCNLGIAEGDVNVGGIVGSVAIEYDFDPEDDLTISGTRTLETRYLLRAVIRGCTNEGSITAKKNQVGGIVGSMDFGRIIDCRGYGSVTSTNGSNVGGIAGASYGGIQGCWAMCRLSGKDYVGGIAGIGSSISDCRSLIDVELTGPNLGAIAGQVEEDAELNGNLFVHHILAGVDGVSYSGMAEPVSYEAFCMLDGLPAAFTQFELTFVANGEVILVVPFRYGDSLEQLPEIPEMSGYSARWPELDMDFLSFSRTLEAEYRVYNSALSDGTKIPQYLVSGSFSPEAQVSVTQTEANWSTADGDAFSGTAYTVRVEDAVVLGVDYFLHWRLEEHEDYSLWIYDGMGWTKQDIRMDGTYLLLNLPADGVTFCLVPQAGISIVVLLAAGVALMGILLLVLCLVRRRRKRKNAAVSGSVQ